jgi:hypothetical protein
MLSSWSPSFLKLCLTGLLESADRRLARRASPLIELFEQFRNDCGRIKIALGWFSLGGNDEKARRFPDFLQRSTGLEPLCATFFDESRMQLGGSTSIYRKSGFGLHPLRNCF